MVNLTIDGKQVTVKRTATIYQAAKEAGIDIPVLCYAKKLLPYGACRVCLVEVEQMKGRLIPSCTTPVTEGMVVTTSSPEIRKVRKTVLEFLLVNHVVECPVCDKGGECDLQDLTYEYEVVTNRFEGVKFDLPKDEVNPLIERNMNRCVLCGKCARVCDEIVGYGSYSFINRGFETKIATAFDRGLNCEFCGQCVSMCPVGAILPRPFKFRPVPGRSKKSTRSVATAATAVPSPLAYWAIRSRPSVSTTRPASTTATSASAAASAIPTSTAKSA
jgi:NADH dehydrogenase/NADH:ubiquinone oxidoreductase subunit G